MDGLKLEIFSSSETVLKNRQKFIRGGSMALWLGRWTVIRGPWLKSSSLPLAVVVFGSPELNFTTLCK